MDNAQADPKPSRRDILKLGASTIGGLAVAPGLLRVDSTAQPAAHRRPNLVILTSDGHRPDALSFSGNRILETPNLDRIGREGISFRNSFVVNALCLPARATLLTGLYSHTTGAVDNGDQQQPANPPGIPLRFPIVSDLLREAGYEVAFCGKSHVKDALRDRYWDYYFGYHGQALYFRCKIAEGRKGQIGEDRPYEDYVDDVVTEKAVAWLREKREKPFCLFLWFYAPHRPFMRPRHYLDLYDGVNIPKPGTFDDDLRGYPGKPRALVESDNKIGAYADVRSLEEITKNYYVGVKTVDDNVGRLFQALGETGQMDDTAVLFTSDHGFFLGEWRLFDKRFMHEPSIRVPFLLRYPKLVKGGLSAEAMVLNLDIAPTMLDLAGVTVPKQMQGLSLVPFLRGDKPEWRKDWLYEYYEDPCPGMVRRNRGVRTERYKFIHYYEPPEEFELYDLQEDPGELRNLFGDPRYSELIEQMRRRIQDLRRETGDV